MLSSSNAKCSQYLKQLLELSVLKQITSHNINLPQSADLNTTCRLNLADLVSGIGLIIEEHQIPQSCSRLFPDRRPRRLKYGWAASDTVPISTLVTLVLEILRVITTVIMMYILFHNVTYLNDFCSSTVPTFI